MKTSIFSENKKYTFSDYFDMTASTEDIVTELGYQFSIEKLNLPTQNNYDSDIITKLNNNYNSIFAQINLSSELAKREFLIAPLLIALTQHSTTKINVEYPIYINEKLSGSLDYLLKTSQEIIIIEAKRKDIDSGFNQLVAQLIAMDNYEDNASIDTVYGAITLGDVWKFALLNRATKTIKKDIYSYTIPHNTDEIFAILMGILNI
ncbi:MAG: hypothetical protein WAX77_12085 [Methylococcaceae bacterium]